MEGLKGRQVIDLPPTERAELEALAQYVVDWKNSVQITCATCGQDAWLADKVGGNQCKGCCTHEGSIVRGYIIKVNGMACAQALCLACGRRGDIRKDDHAPIRDVCFRDNVIVDETRRCSHCGAHGVEEQHWAPRAIFNDADMWPTSPLCRPCHRLWHAAMRAAKGVSLPVDQRIGSTPAWYAA